MNTINLIRSVQCKHVHACGSARKYKSQPARFHWSRKHRFALRHKLILQQLQQPKCTSAEHSVWAPPLAYHLSSSSSLVSQKEESRNADSFIPFFFVGADCLPVQRSEQPPRCRDSRPRSSQDAPCNENEKVRRYFLHESNPKGCKKFGICPNDAAKYDSSMQNNYFLSFEDCQKECMQRKYLFL